VGDPKKQHHDWEPGIAPSGLFWTVPIPPSAISYDARTGAGHFRLSTFALPDFGNFFNAVSKHPSPAPKPSHATFDVRWHGGNDPLEIRDGRYGFAGTFVDGPATISFTAKNDGSNVVYRSVSSGQKALYAGAGMERNGVFFA
jgi:hypothetical protein